MSRGLMSEGPAAMRGTSRATARLASGCDGATPALPQPNAMDTLSSSGSSPLRILMTATPGRLPATAALIGALGSALFAACTGEPARTSERPFVVAITNDPGHLNPAITTNGGVHTAAALLYDGLLAYDSLLAPQPALATRWEVEEAGARYRFHLR